MMIVLRKTVIVVKVERKKTSGQVFKSSYCSIWGKLGQYLKPTGHMIRDIEREGEKEREREGERGVGLEALQG